MLTRDQILRIVGKTWWENDNVLMDFIHNHLSREGAKIFTKEHCAFAAHFPQWFGNVITPVPTSNLVRINFLDFSDFGPVALPG